MTATASARAGQRRHSRLSLNLPARLEVNGSCVAATLCNLSFSGAGIECGKAVAAGTIVRIEWSRFSLPARVVWFAGGRGGLSFANDVPGDVLLETRDLNQRHKADREARHANIRTGP